MSAEISVLWPKGSPGERSSPPEYFSDLNLDVIVEAICAWDKEHDLRPLFWTPLRDPEAVRFRQEVMRDLEDGDVRARIRGFLEGLQRVRRHLNFARELSSRYHRMGWHLEAAHLYCKTVEGMAKYLEALPLRSRGLRSFLSYVRRYISSPSFRKLSADVQRTKESLSQVRYCVTIEPGKFRVKPYEGEADYSTEVEEIFRKFKRREARGYGAVLLEGMGVSHIEGIILDFVARLFPRPFALLEEFHKEHGDFFDGTIGRFEREIRFYLAYLDFIAQFKRRGLPFSYPELDAERKEEHVEDGFDLALAHALKGTDREVVLNGYTLKGQERVLVVTGPNQGGKTTFARMFGQLHYLASLGCPVPARTARLFLPDQIFTHFQREEEVEKLRGRLEDDLWRIRQALERATPRSIFVLNEIFSSTTLRDALRLSELLLERLLKLGVIGVWVTFVDELASRNERVVSMVAGVDPRDPSVRTFKIERRPADGAAFALSLARKHGLSYEQLKERIPG